MDRKTALFLSLFLTAILSIPAAAAQTDANDANDTDPSGCITISIIPPGVTIDPSCLPPPEAMDPLPADRVPVSPSLVPGR